MAEGEGPGEVAELFSKQGLAPLTAATGEVEAPNMMVHCSEAEVVEEQAGRDLLR